MRKYDAPAMPELPNPWEEDEKEAREQSFKSGPPAALPAWEEDGDMDEQLLDEEDHSPFDLSLFRQDHNMTLRLNKPVQMISPQVMTAIIDRLHDIEATADDSKNLYKLQEGLIEAINDLEINTMMTGIPMQNPIKQVAALSHLAKSTLLKGERHVVVAVCFDRAPNFRHFNDFGEKLKVSIETNEAFKGYDVQLDVRANCIAINIPYGGRDMQLIIKPCVSATGLDSYKDYTIPEAMEMQGLEELIAKDVIYEVCLEAAQTHWLIDTLKLYTANGRSVKDFCLIWRDLRVRFPACFRGFSDWLIELFAIHCLYNVSFIEGDFGPRHKRLTKIENPCLQIPAAIKRSFELVASGFFSARSTGLRDPLLPGHPKVHLKCMDMDDMDAACAGAQTILRLVALEQARLVFGLGRKKNSVHHEEFDVATAPNDDGLLLQQSNICGVVFEPSVPLRDILEAIGH